MSVIVKSYRVTKNFDEKLKYIQKHLYEESGLDYSQSVLLDEMIDLYYLRMTAKENILSDLFKEESRNNLIMFQNENAKMYNHLMKNINTRLDEIERKLNK